MNGRRRPSQASRRRKAEQELLEEYVRDTPLSQTKPMIDSATTRATPCPYDDEATEESLP